MEMRFITGRAGTGKTYKIFQEIKENLNKNKKLFLIVPEQFTLQTEFDLITKMNLTGIMEVEVLSFERLAYKVLTEVGGIKKTAINDLGKVMILRRLFDDHSKDLSIYKNASKQSGFLINFSEMVCEFKRNDITPEDLHMKTQFIEGDSMLKQKLSDIAYMFGQFNSYMKDKYTDDEDRFNLLIEKLEEVEIFNNSEIWIDGYTGFTSQQFRIIERLVHKAQRINFGLTIDFNNIGDRDLFYPTQKTYDKLLEICNAYGVKHKKVALDSNLDKKSNELEYLEGELFKYPSSEYKGNVNNINIFSGANPYTEVENVAGNIVSLIRDKKYRWKDVAVVVPAMSSYAPIIKRVFREYDIPFFIDEKRNIMNNLIIKLILSSLDIVNRGFKYEDVFKYAKTGFTDLNRDEWELLENYALKYGIRGDKWFDDFIYEDDNLELINKVRKSLIKPFDKLRKRLKKSNGVKDKTLSLIEFLSDLNIESKLQQWIDELTESGNLDYVNENTQIWNIVMEVFEQMVEILGDTKISLKEYINVLQTGFSEYRVGLIPPTLDQVLVGSLERSKSHDIKALFVVGANDGILPSGFSDDGIILDDEKQSMKDIGISITSDIETKACEERFSIYTMFSKPSEELYISFALADNEGTALRRSIFIDRIKNIFPELNIESDIIMNEEKELRQISTPMSTFKYLIEYLRQYIEGNEISEMWWDVYNWYYNNDNWQGNIKNTIEGLFHDNQEGYIGEEFAKELYNTPLRASISRLERFINCPFAHFVNYGLKPKERKEYKVEKFDIGTLFHNSVEEFSKKIKVEKIEWSQLDREKCDRLVEELVDELIPKFGNNILLSSHRYKYLSKKLKRVSKRAVWTLTEHIKRGEFIPIDHELGFGEGKDDQVPPIVLQLPNGEEIRLEGRIDRIDVLDGEDKQYIKVIDYKSGNKKFSLSEVYYGLQIQLIVYLDAVIENIQYLKNKSLITKDEVHPAGVFYFKIDDPMINSDERDTEVIENEILKQLKMDGLLIKDVKVVKSMDNSIEDGGRSDVIPAYITKKGELSKTSSTADYGEIKGLISHVKNLVVEMAVEILKGNIKIQPCKVNQRVSCDFCKYSSICQFDTTIDNNEFRNIAKLKDEEVLQKIKEERSEE
ncbi:MAG: helicase-exonuclease AddAB subunit AddB [Firmicutes bacterium]|nr:helicase-exonuclease AddAB subunit AddB [Bacillota bacterium]